MIFEDIDKSLMKKGVVPVTTGLFYEFSRDKNSQNIYYSIKSEDVHDIQRGRVYPSLHRLFVDFGDPTEYNFANTYLINYAHWREISEHPMVTPYLALWREELLMKIKADAINSIVAASKGESKDAITAARWLLQSDTWFTDSRRSGRGRPSNKDKQLLSLPTKDENDVLADFDRILNVKNLV